MTLKEVDAIVRETALRMLQSDGLPQRYVTALNMILEHSQASCAGFRRWKPEEIKPGKKEIREPL